MRPFAPAQGDCFAVGLPRPEFTPHKAGGLAMMAEERLGRLNNLCNPPMNLGAGVFKKSV